MSNITRASSASRNVEADRGFTLIELAVVVFVVTIILGSILVPLSAQVEQRQVADTQRMLEEAREALIGYAIAHGSIPCPDSTGNGIEDFDPNTGRCEPPDAPIAEGNLPWVTLGMASADSWGNRIRYRVSLLFAVHAGGTDAPFTLDTSGALRLCEDAACAKPLSVVSSSTNSPIAVLVSHGPNGWGAINAMTGMQRLPAGCVDVPSCSGASGMSADERANGDDNDIFVSRPPSVRGAASGEFDDIVVWLSPHVLKNRMVSAGRLP